MRAVAFVLLLLIIVVLLVALITLVAQLDVEKSRKRLVERIVEEKIVEVQEPFVYYTGLELNEEVIKIAEGGGTQKLFDFFNTFTENPKVTEVIFEESLLIEVPIVSAFALAWGESRYKTQKVNKNVSLKGVVLSRDWGLYQLNDAHRKNWTKEDFLNIRKNAHEGLSFFKHVLKAFNGELVLAYGGYNKGINGLRSGDIPYLTIAHANNIIAYERDMEIKLNYFVNRWKNEQ